jgi:hypothetical protein
VADLHHTLASRAVVTPSGCAEWIASKNKGGYGVLWFPVAKKMQQAHRVSFMLSVGPIPDGLHVLHRCDNPACINPDHLWLGTNADNHRDKADKGRARGAHLGSSNVNNKLTEAQVIAIRADMRLMREIAQDYGITTSTVSNIRHGQTWKHLK